jgi:hypothetical protein
MALFGLFSGADIPHAPTRDRRKRVLSFLEKQSTQKQDPSEDDRFQLGLSELRRRIEDRRDRDSASAAARGLTGSQFEIAQQGNRTRAMAEGTSKLLSSAASRQQREQFRSLGALLSGLDQQDDNYWRRRAEKVRRRGQILGALSRAAGSVASAFTGGVGGGGGSGPSKARVLGPETHDTTPIEDLVPNRLSF